MRIQDRRIYRNYSGQSLSEYGLVAASIGIVAMGVLLMLGNNMSLLWDGLTRGMEREPNAQVSAYGTREGTNQANIGMQNVTLRFSGGQSITLIDYPADLKQSIATVGANGTTTQLSNNLASLALQLVQSGEIDQVQANLLIQLSNQGHRLAKIEGLIGTQVEKGDWFDKNAEFDGNKVSLQELHALIGWDDTISLQNPTDLLRFQKVGSESRQFATYYQSVVDAGLLKDPAIEKLVTTLSTQILVISESAEISLDAVKKQEVPAQEFNAEIAENVTNLNSASICTSKGSAHDTGVFCSN